MARPVMRVVRMWGVRMWGVTVRGGVLRGLIVRGVVLLALMCGALVAPPASALPGPALGGPAVRGTALSALAVVPAAAPAALELLSVPAARKKPRAWLTATGTIQAAGRVRVSVTTNARKVSLTYRTAKGTKRTATITIRRGHGVKRLAAGSTRIHVRARATSTLRRSLLVRVVPVPAEVPGPTPTTAPGPAPSTAPPTTGAVEVEVVTLVNEARSVARTCGPESFAAAPALAVNDLLTRSARGHSTDMALNGYFSHTGLDGSQPWDRMTAVGYQWLAAGENIAAGQRTPREVVGAWLDSPGHCSNIMSGEFTEIGVGYAYAASSTYTHYWTQNFGRR